MVDEFSKEEELLDEARQEAKNEPFYEWKNNNLHELQSEFCEDIMEDEFNEWCRSRFNQLGD